MTTVNRTNEPSHNRITIRAFRDGEVSIIHEDQVLGLACTLDELKRAVATYEARGALEAADRPAGTFTEAQVEAAAKALHETRNPWFGAYGAWGAAGFEIKQAFRESASAALVAAQGTVPQAEQATYLNVAHSSVLAGSINARRAAREVSAMQLIDAIYDPDEDDANDSVRYGYVLEQFERLRVIYADLDDPDAGPAPVLPSSTESPVEPFKTWFACWWKNEPNAIAESNAQSAFYAGWDARWLPSSGVDEDALAEVVRKSENAWQKATGPTTRHEWIARAVAEWLKGQGRGSEM